MSCQAQDNNLEVAALPSILTDFNILEKHLVTPTIPFMKLVTLPKSFQKGICGPIVCVPADLSKTVHCLPRPLTDSTLIQVKLKRKLEYVGHHIHQVVDPLKKPSVCTYKNINPC